MTTTSQQATASFVSILTVRDGQIVHWREFQATLGMAAALRGDNRIVRSGR